MIFNIPLGRKNLHYNDLLLDAARVVVVAIVVATARYTPVATITKKEVSKFYNN